MKTIAKKLSEVRKNMKECCDEVYKGADLFVTRKNNENVVLISESRYNALIGKVAEPPADPAPVTKGKKAAVTSDKSTSKKAEKAASVTEKSVEKKAENPAKSKN